MNALPSITGLDEEKHNHTSDIRAEFVSTLTLTVNQTLDRPSIRRPTPRATRRRDPTARPRRTMTLPSADELLTGVSKHAHGSVDGIEDSENKRIDWRAVGAGLRHYLSGFLTLA